MPTSAATTLPDMHREPAAHPPRLGQLVLILVLGAHTIDLPAALTPRLTPSIELHTDLLGRLTMSMPAVLATRPDDPDDADSPKARRARTAPPDACPHVAPPPAGPRASRPFPATAQSPQADATPHPTTLFRRRREDRTRVVEDMNAIPVRPATSISAAREANLPSGRPTRSPPPKSATRSSIEFVVPRRSQSVSAALVVHPVS